MCRDIELHFTDTATRTFLIMTTRPGFCGDFKLGKGRRTADSMAPGSMCAEKGAVVGSRDGDGRGICGCSEQCPRAARTEAPATFHRVTL
jgi:hypothetical protein